jgi:hypothetical protein
MMMEPVITVKTPITEGQAMVLTEQIVHNQLQTVNGIITTEIVLVAVMVTI